MSLFIFRICSGSVISESKSVEWRFPWHANVHEIYKTFVFSSNEKSKLQNHTMVEKYSNITFWNDFLNQSKFPDFSEKSVTTSLTLLINMEERNFFFYLNGTSFHNEF